MRNLETAQETYQELLNKRQDVGVRENQLTNFIRIIEPAIPPDKPSSKTAKKILALGIVAGLAFALTIIVAVDFIVIDVKGTSKAYGLDSKKIPAGLQ